jgi:hypothetical protein
MATDLAVSTGFGSLATYTYPGFYDPTKLGLGPLMMQANNAGNEGKWVGPVPVNVARPMETTAAVPGQFPNVIPWGAQGSGATVTFTVTSNVITGVTASPPAGGSGYTPNSTLYLNVTSGGGTGGIVTATTNAYGVVTSYSTTPYNGGSGYTGTTGATTSWTSTNYQYDWVVLSDNATAANTRRYQLYTFNRTMNIPGVSPWAFQGFITATYPNSGGATAMTCRGHGVIYNTYAVGTAGVTNNNAAVTGSGTAWSASRLFIGSRIGFGSTDPTQITTWYEISAIGSDTSITLTTNYLGSTQGTIAYVIEDFRILAACTSATVTNGGLFMIAGLRPEIFTNAGTTISAAASTDKVRAVYWLADALGAYTNNATIQTHSGIDIDAMTDWTHQNAYVLSGGGGTNSQIQISNFRNAMTLGGTTAGRESANGTFVLNTGVQVVTGNISQAANLVLCTPGVGGGPRNGVKSLFFVTASRLYSVIAANVTSTSTNFIAGSMTENPPGTTSTFAATASLANVNYSIADRFLVMSTGGASSLRSYYTQYREDGGQWDRILLSDAKQLQQSTIDPTVAVIPGTNAAQTVGLGVGTCNGITYMITMAALGSSTAANNFLYSIPFAADWEYAGLGTIGTTNCCVVTPAMSTSQFASFVAGYFNAYGVIGGLANPSLGRTGTNLGIEPGAVRMYYRTNVGTAGPIDNGGTWTLLDYSGNMTGFAVGTQVQARLEFRVANLTGIPARVTRVCFEGTGSASISNFQFSQAQTNLSTKKFAFRQAVALGGSTTLWIRIYDAVANTLLVTDNTASPTGTWEYSTNGGSSYTTFSSPGSGAQWNASWDYTNTTTYLRYTPASIADSINVMPVVSLS